VLYLCASARSRFFIRSQPNRTKPSFSLSVSLFLSLSNMTMMPGFLWRAKSVGRIPSLAVALRRRSSKAGASQVVKVDMAEYDVALKHFDDLIHRILVKKATPDWLPFVPGSSFWVPPRPSPTNVVDLVHRLTREDDRPHDSPLLSTLRGWPSSNFFINGNYPSHKISFFALFVQLGLWINHQSWCFFFYRFLVVFGGFGELEKRRGFLGVYFSC